MYYDENMNVEDTKKLLAVTSSAKHSLCMTVYKNILTESITVQRDATQSSLFIILQVYSTCFGCQTHPSSGVHKTVNTASGTGHIFLCSYLPPTWPNFTCFGCQPHPSSGKQKTVTTTSGTGHIFCAAT